MKVLIKKTSNMLDIKFIEIDTLEDLLKLKKEVDEDIIIVDSDRKDIKFIIEVYDDYRE